MSPPAHALTIWSDGYTFTVAFPDGQLIDIPDGEAGRVLNLIRCRAPGRRLPPQNTAEWDHAIRRKGAEVRQRETEWHKRERRKAAKQEEILKIIGAL